MSLDAPPVLSVSEAAEAERNAVLAHTHAIWGGKRTLEKYRQACSELLETPWGRKNYRFYVGKDAAGQVVTACKIYDLDMWAAGRVVRTIGFGAVFTLPEARRQGMRRECCRASCKPMHSRAIAWPPCFPPSTRFTTNGLASFAFRPQWQARRRIALPAPCHRLPNGPAPASGPRLRKMPRRLPR